MQWLIVNRFCLSQSMSYFLVLEEVQSWFMEELVSFKGLSCLPNPSVRKHADWNTLSAKVWAKTCACQMKCFHRGPKHNSHKSDKHDVGHIILMFPLKLNVVLLSVQNVKTILKACLKQMCTCKVYLVCM